MQQASNAVLTGNVAVSGSTSNFIYGTVIVENSMTTTCATTPASLKNANYILATQNDAAFGGSCGFGGVITSVSSGSYTVPYLVYGGNLIFKT